MASKLSVTKFIIVSFILILGTFTGITVIGLNGPNIVKPQASQDNNIEWEGILHDSRGSFYRNPGFGSLGTGAVPVGTDVTMKIRAFKNDLTVVKLRIWSGPLSQELIINMVVTESDNTYDYWEATITSPSTPSDYYYAFILIDGTDTDWYNDDIVTSVYEDNRVYQTGGKGVVTDNHVSDGDYSLIFHDPTFVTPEWHKQAVGYQIFTDRFFNGETANDPVGDGTSGDVIWWEWDSNGNGVKDADDEKRIYVEKHDIWDELPQGGFDYFGGDLQGVMQKVDYLNELGVDFIWFNPFTQAGDNHGYSVDDYRALNAYYGIVSGRDNGRVINNVTASMEFFDTFEQTLESNGIKIIYDTVINHASAQSTYFQRFENSNNFQAPTGYDVPDYYPGIAGAYENPFNPYFKMFKFNEYNHDYDGWFGFNHIPTIQYSGDSGALEELVTGPNNIFDYWLEHGVDGFRLDVNGIYADGQGSRLVNQAIRNAVKSSDPNAVILGEIWERASTWLAGNMNDGTQNMPFRFNTIDWMRGFYDDQTYSELMLAIKENYPKEALYSLWVNLGNHDRSRILSTMEGITGRVKVASTLQFAYPGVPVIWYGDEVGVQGFGDPGTRQPYPWGNEDLDLLSHYKKIINIKKSYPVMIDGDFQIIDDDQEGVIGFYRSLSGDKNEHALVLTNRDAVAKRVNFDLSNTNIVAGTPFADLMNDNTVYEVGDKEIQIDIPAYGTLILMSGIAEPITSSSISSETPSTTISITESTPSKTNDSPGLGFAFTIISMTVMIYLLKSFRTKKFDK